MMSNFEFNWATAEMVKMYLRNSRAQEKRKARLAAENPATSQGVSAADVGPAATGGAVTNRPDESDSDSDSESEDEE